MVGQIFSRRQHPLKPLPAGARGRFTGTIPWGHLFIPSPLIQGHDRLLDLRIADDEEPPSLHVSTARRTDTRLQDLTDQFVWHRVRFKPPHRPSGADDVEQISAVVFARHGVLSGAIGSAELVRWGSLVQGSLPALKPQG